MENEHEDDSLDMAQICVEFAHLKGIDPVAATEEITEIVEMLLFSQGGLSDTYHRLRQWADEYQGGDIGRAFRLASSYGSHILAACLFEKLYEGAQKEGLKPPELLVRILKDYFKDTPEPQ